MPTVSAYWLHSANTIIEKHFAKELEAWASMSEAERIEAEKRHYGKAFPPITGTKQGRARCRK